MDLSFVIPVYNEEGNVEELYSALKKNADLLDKSYEIIFIDDGSQDGTPELLKGLVAEDRRVKAIFLERNMGKSYALNKGFHEAAGDVVFTLDGDLQDDPGEIGKFIDEIGKGFDVVVGWRYKRNDPPSKLIPSKIFNKLTQYLSDVKIHDFNCGFKACKKEVVKKIRVYGELHRYIPVLADWKGFRVGEVKVRHNPRKRGKSKYGFTRLVKGFLDLLNIKFMISYLERPMHFFGGLGVLSLSAACVLGLYLLYVKYGLGEVIGDRPLIFLVVLLGVFGVQFLSLGLLSEIVVNQNLGDFRKEE